MASELFVPPAIGPKGEFDNHVRRLEEAFSGIYRISQLEDSVQKLMQNFGLSVPQPEEPQTQSQPAREEVTKSPEISSSIGIAKEQISAMGLTQIEEESEPLFSPETKQISNDVVITSEKKDEIQPSPLVSSALDVTKTNEKSNLISLELKNTESKEFLSVETNQSFWVTTTTDGFVERFFRFKEVLSEEYLRPISVGLKGEELARYYLEEGWPPDPGWETFKQFPLAWFRSIQGCNHQEKLVIFTQISTEKEPRLQFAIFSTPTRRLPESNFAAMHEKGRLQADLKQIGFSGLRTWLKMAQIIKVKRIAMSTYKFGLNSLWPEHTPSGTHLSSKTTHLITFPNIPTTLSTTTLPLTSPATYPSISSLKPAEPKFEEKPILPKFISTITEPITKIAKIKIEEKSAKEKTENGGEKRRLEVEFKDEVKVHVKIDTETVEVKDPTPKLREYSDPKSGVGDGNADFVRQSTDVNQFHALEVTIKITHVDNPYGSRLLDMVRGNDEVSSEIISGQEAMDYIGDCYVCGLVLNVSKVNPKIENRKGILLATNYERYDGRDKIEAMSHQGQVLMSFNSNGMGVDSFREALQVWPNDGDNFVSKLIVFSHLELLQIEKQYHAHTWKLGIMSVSFMDRVTSLRIVSKLGRNYQDEAKAVWLLTHQGVLKLAILSTCCPGFAHDIEFALSILQAVTKASVQGEHWSTPSMIGLEVLILWKDLPAVEDAWKLHILIQEQFPCPNLEDKVALWAAGNDRTPSIG